MEKFQRIIFEQSGYCLIERHMDVSVSAYLAPYLNLTVKTTQAKLDSGAWTWREIQKLIPALRRLDGSNPFLDAVHNELLEAQR